MNGGTAGQGAAPSLNFLSLTRTVRRSLRDAEPPPGLPALLVLWHGLRGEWGASHRIVQDYDGTSEAWIYA